MTMIEKEFRYVSASEAGDYYQVLFEDDEDGDSTEGPYVLIQRQFEFPDDAAYYMESDDRRLCGHFTVRSAKLNREFLSIEFLAEEWTTLILRYSSCHSDCRELERILRIMFGKVLAFDYAPTPRRTSATPEL